MDENERKKHCEKLNNFCFVCGKFTVKADKRHLNSMKEALACYKYYFLQPEPQQNKYSPEFTCISCISALNFWWNKKRFSLPFGLPMIWTDPGQHETENCYACTNDTFGLNRKSKSL